MAEPKPKRPQGRPRKTIDVSHVQRWVRCDDCAATGVDLQKLRDGGGKTACPVCRGEGRYLADETVSWTERVRVDQMKPTG